MSTFCVTVHTNEHVCASCVFVQLYIQFVRGTLFFRNVITNAGASSHKKRTQKALGKEDTKIHRQRWRINKKECVLSWKGVRPQPCVVKHTGNELGEKNNIYRHTGSSVTHMS